MPFEIVGVMDNVIVRFVDLSPEGVGLLSPHAITPGRTVELRVELPMSDGRDRETRLRLRVTSCRITDADRGAEPRVWRIGGAFTVCDDADREALVESADVLVARAQLSQTARLLAELAALAPAGEELTLGSSELTESLAANG